MTTLISGTCQCGNKIRGAKSYCVKCRKALEHRPGEGPLDYRIRTAPIYGNLVDPADVRERDYYATMWNDPELNRLEKEKERAFAARRHAEAYRREDFPAADAAVTRAIHRLHEYIEAGVAKARRR